MGCTAWAGYLNASSLSSTGVSYPYLKVLHLFFSKATVIQIQYVLCAVPKQLSFKASGRKRGSIIDVLLPSPPLSMIMLEKDFRTVSSRVFNSYLRIDPSWLRKTATCWTTTVTFCKDQHFLYSSSVQVLVRPTPVLAWRLEELRAYFVQLSLNASLYILKNPRYLQDTYIIDFRLCYWYPFVNP